MQRIAPCNAQQINYTDLFLPNKTSNIICHWTMHWLWRADFDTDAATSSASCFFCLQLKDGSIHNKSTVPSVCEHSRYETWPKLIFLLCIL